MPKTSAERIHDAVGSIRDWVNEPRLRQKLMAQTVDRNQIASSLDALGDTEMALGAYLSQYPVTNWSQVGLQYLLLYGVLQALYVEQFAALHLAEALGTTIPFKDPRLLRARVIRNTAVGHPTRSEKPKGKPISTHQISRMTLAQGGFQMLSSDEHGDDRFETIDMPQLIEDQRAALAEALEAVDSKLTRDDATLRAPFQQDTLASVFPDSLGYAFEKLYETTWGKPSSVLGRPSLDQIKRTLADFTQALQRRELTLDSYSGVGDWFREIAHPIAVLDRFLDDPTSLEPETASIVVEHLQRHVDELKEMAGSIDHDWATGQR